MITKFTYRNHRGEVEEREVDVDSVEFIRDPGFNYQPGWFISGIDQSRMQRRSFALVNVVLPEKEKYFAVLKIREQ